MHFILDTVDLLSVADLDLGECRIVDDSVDELFFSYLKFALEVYFGCHKLFLLVADIGFLFLVDAFHFGDHLVDEFSGELQPSKFLGDLIFQIKNFNVLVCTFLLIVGPIAVIVCFLFQRMILGRIALAALITKYKPAQ